MSIELELRKFLQDNLFDNEFKNRDINLILYYYGFGDGLWPTLEDAAEKFEVGESSGRRAERPRQIIQEKFRGVASIDLFPMLNDCAETIDAKPIHRGDGLKNKLLIRGYFEGAVNLRGLLNLLHDLGVCTNYEMYSPDLIKIQRSTYQLDETLLLVDKRIMVELKKQLKLAKTLPGQLGIADISYLRAETQGAQWFSELVDILKMEESSWFLNTEDSTYYLIESRDNTIVNSLEKIRAITEVVELGQLVDVISNGLRRRAHRKYSYVADDIIKRYLQSSKHVDYNGRDAVLNVEPGVLTPIDRDILKYFEGKELTSSPELRGYLSALGYGSPHIVKAVFHSPILHKTGERGSYQFQLVGATVSTTPTHVDSRYRQFIKRLRQVGIQGTDETQLTVRRREQHILRDWLFEDKTTECCAICGQEYSITSLVAAHKKKRADCAENERTDPYIVMPLCLFGCDFLYEQSFVHIEQGVVKDVPSNTAQTVWEESIINSVAGRELDERWRLGPAAYFR